MVSAILLLPFLLTAIALLYNHSLLLQKLQIVREEISIPASEENVLITRIRFLCINIQNSHFKVLTYANQNRQDELQAEISSLRDLTAIRVKELKRLQASVEKSNQKDSAPSLLLENLEKKVSVLDLKHEEFLTEIESSKNKGKSSLSSELSAEWNDLHKQVIDAESAFLDHNEKGVSEIRELSDVIKEHSQKIMFFVLIVGFAALFLVIGWINYNIVKTLENIKCPPRTRR